MRRQSNNATQPTTMIHHVREIQLRLLAIAAVLIVGMVIGYIYYEPLFEFIRAPLNAPLHYMSPAGSFTFIIKICLMIGTIAALPVAVYNVIMFVQPALETRLSRLRVYLTTVASLVLALAGASFGYLVILPLALRFFFKFQVNGLVAIISADEYFRFVVSVIVTFVIIFQLPLLMSLADHIRPLPPKKLLKFEKYIIVGSIFIGVVVPFALDPTVQLLIASPIIILYNLSIAIIYFQHVLKRRKQHAITPKNTKKVEAPVERAVPAIKTPVIAPQPLRSQPQPVISMVKPQPAAKRPMQPQRSIDGTVRMRRRPASPSPIVPPARTQNKPVVPRRLITDMRPARRTPIIGQPLHPGTSMQPKMGE